MLVSHLLLKTIASLIGFLGAALLCFSRRYSNLLGTIEKVCSALARRKRLAIISIAGAAIILRLSLLLFVPVPVPENHDEFSYLLGADTFTHGRLANPTHPMSIYFETFHVNQHPTYISIYPPAQAGVLALGQILGQPWIGVLLSVAAMCAAILWALQGWLPSRWALLGAALVLLRLGLSSYWINSYWGGAVAAIGGALVLGAQPRIIRFRRPRDAFVLGLGAAVLANSRPLEGLVFCVPVLAAILISLRSQKIGIRAGLLRVAAPICLVLVACVGFMLYYNARGTGNPLLFPYVVNVENHFAVPQTIFQKAHAPFHFQNPQFDAYYNVWWPNVAWQHGRPNTLRGLASSVAWNLKTLVAFFAWPEFCLVLVTIPCLVHDRRNRFLILQLSICFAGFSMIAWVLPHYAAPLTVTLALLLVQGIRHIRLCTLGRSRVGIIFSRALVIAAVLLAPFHSGLLQRHPSMDARARMAQQLEQSPGDHLVIVRYSVAHDPNEEWVNNAADIDGSRIVWAREIPDISMQPLLDYFKDRKVWLVQPDQSPPVLLAYPTRAMP